MKRSISVHTTRLNHRTRVAAGLLVLPALAITAAACGSPNHPQVTSGGDPGALATGPTEPSAGVTGSSSGAAAPGAGTGQSTTWTSPTGYVYRIHLASAGVVAMNSFTTDDGTGQGGTPVDAPPGSTIPVAQVIFDNESGRSEPMVDVPGGVMPTDATGSQFLMAVPVSDASAFKVDSSQCSTSAGSFQSAPAGYCNLSTQIGAFSPAQTDITQPPQLAPGTTGTVTFIASPGVTGGWVPQSAPISDVKVFYSPSTTCGCWTPLGQ